VINIFDFNGFCAILKKNSILKTKTQKPIKMKRTVLEKLTANSIVYVEYAERGRAPGAVFVNQTKSDDSEESTFLFLGRSVDYLINHCNVVDIEETKDCNSYFFAEKNFSLDSIKIKTFRPLTPPEIKKICERVKDFKNGSKNAQKIHKFFSSAFFSASIGKTVQYHQPSASS